MIFRFKFNLGQEVFYVKEYSQYEYKPCELCKGTGSLHILEEPHKTVSCHGCRESRRRPYKKRKTWQVNEQSLNIGQCRCEINDKDKNQWADRAIKEEYMCAETGVGSGQIHKVEELFATKEQAQAFCDEQNARIDWEITNND